MNTVAMMEPKMMIAGISCRRTMIPKKTRNINISELIPPEPDPPAVSAYATVAAMSEGPSIQETFLLRALTLGRYFFMAEPPFFVDPYFTEWILAPRLLNSRNHTRISSVEKKIQHLEIKGEIIRHSLYCRPYKWKDCTEKIYINSLGLVVLWPQTSISI
jgi:hypothetical protein